MKEIITNLRSENKFAIYSSLFRIFIGIYLLKDVYLMWDFNELFFEASSFLEPTNSFLLDFFNIDTAIVRNNFTTFYSCYIIIILLYILGIGKNYTALVLLFFLEVVQNLTWITLNGGDNIIKIVMIYMIFIDSFRYFTISKGYKNETTNSYTNFLSNLAGYSICIHLCLIYFISAVHKINADVWFNGVATYYILAGERFIGTPWNIPLVKNGYFVTLSTYGTILIELLYPFLIWFRNTRKIFIISAIMLHTGIAIFMMLYDFQLVFILLQGFFLSNKFWVKVFQKILNWKPLEIFKTKLSILYRP